MKLWRWELGLPLVVLAALLAGCGSGSSGPEAQVAATPVLQQPSIAWKAPNPGNISQGSPFVSYDGIAASGEVIVGVTFLSPEGTLLARLDPKTGKPLWTAQLPSYAEQDGLAIREGRILLIAPGAKVTPEGVEGEGPAVAYAFSLKGAKLWEDSLGASIDQVRQTGWAPPELPSSSESDPDMIADFEHVPGEIILYEGSELRGIDVADGKEWTYVPEQDPERILASEPGEAPELRVQSGSEVVALDARSGKELERTQAPAKGVGIGLVGPLFESERAEEETPVKVKGIGPVTPLPAFAGSVVYAAAQKGLVAIDTRSGKELWSVPMHSPYDVGPVVAGAGIVVASGYDDEATVLLK